MYYNESIPNCVPEYYRSLQEEQDRQYDLAMQRYQANQRKLDAAAEAGLPILSFAGYDRCWECPHADHDTVTDDDDDICCVICHNNGLLHAEQVDYIVRAAVKLIDHHRVLVLYIYDRAEAAQGSCSPRWTVYQTKDDYVTLARQEDGSLKWRSAAFENLGKDWHFPDKCAIYSARDERQICRYFNGAGGGICRIISAQKAIQERRSRERRIAKERKIVDRMSGSGPLPRGLKGWIQKSIMPAYFLCSHARAHRPVTGTCTSCGHEITLASARHNAKTTCPRCRRELTIKSQAKVGCIYDRDTVQVVQRTGQRELVARIIKAEYCYTDGEVKRYIYENARFFVALDYDGDFCALPYYKSGPGLLTAWREGVRPRLMAYQYSFAGDTCGHVYCHNLGRELAGTPWQYCPVELFYQHYRTPMEDAFIEYKQNGSTFPNVNIVNIVCEHSQFLPILT